MSSDDNFFIAFSTVPGIGSARLKLLMNFFGSPRKAWLADETVLAKVGLPKNVLVELLQQRRKLNVDKYVENLGKRGIKYITISSQDYPQRLINIPDPPNVLFVRTNRDLKEIGKIWGSKKVIGVVGTRKMTGYGKEVTEQLVTGLVSAGFTIVSGMALGVDGIAHQTALNCKGNTTAVLGAGVDVIYPPFHRDLYYQIIERNGAIVSEVAPEKFVNRGVFPARNRIISGLAVAVLVTEGAIDSGSLITVRAALEQGREVFAVPGQINSPMAQGTNYLLKQGAKLVTGISDILEGLGCNSYKYNQEITIKAPKGENGEEQKIIDLLVNEPLGFDDLARKSAISTANLGILLSVMEVKRKIKNTNDIYELCR